jgi:hypothetical protein
MVGPGLLQRKAHGAGGLAGDGDDSNRLDAWADLEVARRLELVAGRLQLDLLLFGPAEQRQLGAGLGRVGGLAVGLATNS